jgi:DNA-binding HxlR family transcriptional regulator
LLAATSLLRYRLFVSRKRFEDMNCGIGQALEVFGDWWSLLIVRDAFFGLTRFSQFQRSLGIAKNILAKRLEHLVDHGIFEKTEAGETGGYCEYRLTPKGEALLTVLMALREWSDEWVFGRGNEPIVMTDRRTGKKIPKTKIRDARGREISRRHLRAVLGPGASDETKQRFSS